MGHDFGYLSGQGDSRALNALAAHSSGHRSSHEPFCPLLTCLLWGFSNVLLLAWHQVLLSDVLLGILSAREPGCPKRTSAQPEKLDGPAIRNANRFAEKKLCFCNMRAIRTNRLKPAIRKF